MKVHDELLPILISVVPVVDLVFIVKDGGVVLTAVWAVLMLLMFLKVYYEL